MTFCAVVSPPVIMGKLASLYPGGPFSGPSSRQMAKSGTDQSRGSDGVFSATHGAENGAGDDDDLMTNS